MRIKINPFVISLLLLVLLPSTSLAYGQEGGNPARGHGHGHHGQGMELMDQEEPGVPWEECWYERPWNFWRHMDEGFNPDMVQLGTLDLDAIHFMGNVRRIAILPFVDNTIPTGQGDSMMEEVGGPRRMAENLAGALMSRGYLVVPPMDAEALYKYYIKRDEIGEIPREEIANNRLFFEVLPERSLNYCLEVVPGLLAQYETIDSHYFMTREDILVLAEMLEVDVIIRGFVNEFAVTRDIDADWRTFIPPFLGLINPDRRVTIEVAYYLYDGHSGEMIWNGSFENRDDAAWPLFESTAELLWNTEDTAILDVTDRILPSWCALLLAHPEWVPHEMWCEWCHCGGCGWDKCWGSCCEPAGPPACVNRPDWLNPMRHGWHKYYNRNELKFNRDPVPCPPDFAWFHDVGGYYGQLRD